MNEVVEVRMSSWKAMVQERNASGLSIKEWCAARPFQSLCKLKKLK